MTGMEVISEQTFGKTSHENAETTTMQGRTVEVFIVVHIFIVNGKYQVKYGEYEWKRAKGRQVDGEEDINGDARVGEDWENEEHKVGEYECVPDCDESIKPYQGQRFQTLDEGVRYYKEYATFVGFDVWGSTMKRNRYGDVEVKYLLCSREGYTVTKAQRSTTTGDGN
nr:protein FAR1-RELATED SEQUENCE 5-like [Ipomoea batatas]